MSLWFGQSWGAPVCDPATHSATPVDAKCIECGVEIVEGDRGHMHPYRSDDELTPVYYHFGLGPVVVYHHECLMRSILGQKYQEEVDEGDNA